MICIMIHFVCGASTRLTFMVLHKAYFYGFDLIGYASQKIVRNIHVINIKNSSDAFKVLIEFWIKTIKHELTLQIE